MENNFQVQQLREKSREDLRSLTVKYIGMLKELSEFMKKLRMAQVSSNDSAAYKELTDEYDHHVKNMNTLFEEINQYPHYESEEQTAVLEIGLEVVSKAANFVLSLPERLASSNFGKAIDDNELMKGIELSE